MRYLQQSGFIIEDGRWRVLRLLSDYKRYDADSNMLFCSFVCSKIAVPGFIRRTIMYVGFCHQVGAWKCFCGHWRGCCNVVVPFSSFTASERNVMYRYWMATSAATYIIIIADVGLALF